MTPDTSTKVQIMTPYTSAKVQILTPEEELQLKEASFDAEYSISSAFVLFY
jgi:hypothetical protein